LSQSFSEIPSTLHRVIFVEIIIEMRRRKARSTIPPNEYAYLVLMN
jgi:hypothetical protein